MVKLQKRVKLQVGVKIIVRNGKGKFLLLQRSPRKYTKVGGEWDIPGGRIHPGSSLLENLKRELFEETGLKIFRKPRLLAAQDILRVPGKHVVRLTYAGGEAKGSVRTDKESRSHGWFSISEMRKMRNLDRYLKEVINTCFVYHH